MTIHSRVVASADDAAVRAVLFPVHETPPGTSTVRLSRASAERAGLSHRAGQTLGGLAPLTTGGWAIAAYTDRRHLLHGGGPVTFLDDVQGDLPDALAALIAHWQRTDTASTTAPPAPVLRNEAPVSSEQ